jgi:hypothetical protein
MGLLALYARWMDGGRDGWMDGWMISCAGLGWTDEIVFCCAQLSSDICTYVCLFVCMTAPDRTGQGCSVTVSIIQLYVVCRSCRSAR